RDGAIETFLTRPVNDALPAPADFFEQFVIAELHLDSTRLLPVIVLLIERSQASSEETNAAKSLRRISKDCSSALRANSARVYHPIFCSSFLWVCTARNSFAGYVCNT